MTYRELWQPLLAHYDEREARAVVMWLLDVVFGMSKTDVACGAVEQMDGKTLARLTDMSARLQQGEPVQYVAGVADFGPRQFVVSPAVLIPRPETYELCRWIAREEAPGSIDVLDIGTGSGCIAVTLASEMNGAQLSAWDISEDALGVARSNAEKYGSNVRFALQDALHAPAGKARWDVIVSNPPYICCKEREGMARHVLDFEPAQALFVPDDEPLLFYQSIARYATTALKENGHLYFELNAAYATETAELLQKSGFGEVQLREDQFGRLRFLKATHR